MSSPGPRRGSCGHAMAGFDSHSKCARCRDKGLGDDPASRRRNVLSVVVLGIGLKNQNRLIGNSEQSIIDYNRFSACFVRKTEYSFSPNIITVVFR